MPARIVDYAPVPEVGTGPPPGLMVLVSDVDDVATVLTTAARRARARRGPLVVALVEPPEPLTIDAATRDRHERRRAGERAALVAASALRCADVPELSFVSITQPRALTRAGAGRALRRRARRAARIAGCELVPAGA